jgi:hypothetical protein
MESAIWGYWWGRLGWLACGWSVRGAGWGPASSEKEMKLCDEGYVSCWDLRYGESGGGFGEGLGVLDGWSVIWAGGV